MSSSRHPSLTVIVPSALVLIGSTSFVAMDRVHPGPRAARAILLAARADGRLAPGVPVVEMTSGNMGAGLAVVCAALGHPLVVTMSVGNSPQRARMLEALGAEVVRVRQNDGVPG